jgi:RsiW-degrading membrane proteinase PrsW (M82 family)
VSDVARPELALALGSLPVLVLLAFLLLLDSYKLVRPKVAAALVLGGSLAAIVSLAVNLTLVRGIGLPADFVRHDFAPPMEEALKGAILVYLLKERRLAFLVDAAIAGFSVGAGFAAIENVVQFLIMPKQGLVLWLIRGCGTAVMHGTVTAIMAVSTQHLRERFRIPVLVAFFPGWVVAGSLHSLFNHFFISPDLSAILLLVAMPLIFLLIFGLGEKGTRAWLGTGFDTDSELLAMINSGTVSGSRVGKYLEALKTRFAPTVVADMLCMLRLRLELSIHAKGILLMRQSGFEVPPDPKIGERFTELAYLERSIGSTGLIALSPVLHMSDRDLWQLHMLRGKGVSRSP